MNNQTKIALIWIILVICMILHFDYHVSGIFYGIDVKRPDATGVQPPTLILIRAMFQILPMIWALAAMFFTSKIYRTINLIAAIIYMPLHGMHIVGTLKETPLDPTQLQLLIFTFLVSIILAFVSFKWLKELKTQAI